MGSGHGLVGFGKKWWLGNGIGNPPSGPSIKQLGKICVVALPNQFDVINETRNHQSRSATDYNLVQLCYIFNPKAELMHRPCPHALPNLCTSFIYFISCLQV